MNLGLARPKGAAAIRSQRRVALPRGARGARSRLRPRVGAAAAAAAAAGAGGERALLRFPKALDRGF